MQDCNVLNLMKYNEDILYLPLETIFSITDENNNFNITAANKELENIKKLSETIPFLIFFVLGSALKLEDQGSIQYYIILLFQY